MSNLNRDDVVRITEDVLSRLTLKVRQDASDLSVRHIILMYGHEEISTAKLDVDPIHTREPNY